MIVKLMVDGGSMKPGPAIAQKIGPLGLNMGKIIQDVNTATKNFAGLKVPVILDINTKTKTFKVEVSSPPTSGLLKKDLGIEKGTGDSKKIKVGNISIEQIIKIAKTKTALEKNLKSSVKTILGSCVSLGILVENRDAKEIEKEVNKGIYDKEIKESKTEPGNEKLAKLKEFFDEVKKVQDALLKKEEEENAAKEAEAAAVQTAPAAETAKAGTPAKTAAPAKAAAPAAAAAPAKTAPAKEKKK